MLHKNSDFSVHIFILTLLILICNKTFNFFYGKGIFTYKEMGHNSASIGHVSHAVGHFRKGLVGMAIQKASPEEWPRYIFLSPDWRSWNPFILHRESKLHSSSIAGQLRLRRSLLTKWSTKRNLNLDGGWLLTKWERILEQVIEFR